MKKSWTPSAKLSEKENLISKKSKPAKNESCKNSRHRRVAAKR